MNFKEYIQEGTEGKNLHLEHLEDNVLNLGTNGTRESIDFLRSLRDMLNGSSETKVNVTTKWDGAPAIFAGVNPDNGQFFVGTKGVFNKNPKLNYTDEDIDNNHPGGGLNQKLKVALRYLPKLGIKGILQGDMMFTKGDLESKNIDGEQYVVFQPNTIVYAVPADSKLAQSMLAAHLGVVWHTSYTGRTFDDMKASFNIDINHLTKTKDVWFRDAYFIDASGTVTFTAEESRRMDMILSDLGALFRKTSSLTLNRIAASDTIKNQIKTFNNTKVRSGEPIKDTMKHVRELILWVEDRQNKEILAAKMQDTKRKRQLEKNELMRFYRNNAMELKGIFDIQNGIIEAKTMVIRKLQQIKQVTGTFLKTDDGYKVTAPEGFVAVDKLKGNALKLVDRLEFSQANFNAAKNWDK
jgi:hypothetical protein